VERSARANVDITRTARHVVQVRLRELAFRRAAVAVGDCVRVTTRAARYIRVILDRVVKGDAVFSLDQFLVFVGH
jgi:hypothetical protein